VRAKVKIIRTTTFVTYPTFGAPKKVVKIEYQMEGFVPRFIFVPFDEYSRDRVKQLILEDLLTLFPDVEGIEVEGI
jgi:hypothetical protein